MGATQGMVCHCQAEDLETSTAVDVGAIEVLQDYGDGDLTRGVLRGGVAAARQQEENQVKGATAPSFVPREKSPAAATPREVTSEAERARLKKLLYDFVKGALEGRPCTWVRERGGHVERASASFRLNKAISELAVRDVQNSGAEPATLCPLKHIMDVYSMAEDDEDCFPAPVLAGIQPEEKDRLLMLVYGAGPQAAESRTICLVMESVKSRDTFLECLRMLCISARTSS
jgi:hypothetical protein